MEQDIYTKLGICGCGEPEVAFKTIADILGFYLLCNKNMEDRMSLTDSKEKEKQILSDSAKEEQLLLEKFGCKSIYDNRLLLTLVYLLDDKGLLEHGTSIGGAWITEEGEECLEEIEKLLKEKQE